MYSLNDGPSPVSSREIRDYIGNLHLLPVTADNITFAEWSGMWESETTDAVEYMNGVYRSLLRDLAAALATNASAIAESGAIGNYSLLSIAVNGDKLARWWFSSGALQNTPGETASCSAGGAAKGKSFLTQSQET